MIDTELLESVIRRGIQAGRFSLDDFLTGIERGSLVILDNYGVTVSAEFTRDHQFIQIAETLKALRKAESDE